MQQAEWARLLQRTDEQLFLELGAAVEAKRAQERGYGALSRDDRKIIYSRWELLIPPAVMATAAVALVFGMPNAIIFTATLIALAAFALLGFARRLWRTRPGYYKAEEKRMAKRFRQKGRREFASLQGAIRVALCNQWHACEKVKLYEDEAQLAIAVADALSAVLSGLPVATVSALVVKIGVKRFCACP
jgi:hypothetical protein